MVIDVAAKKQARAERLEAKKAAIAEQEAQFAPETDPTEEQKAAIEENQTEEKDSAEEPKKDEK